PDRLLEIGFVACGEHDARACTRREPGSHESDAARCAGDDDHLFLDRLQPDGHCGPPPWSCRYLCTSRSVSGRTRSRVVAFNASGGGCFKSRSGPVLVSTSPCETPSSARQKRRVARAPPMRRSRRITSGSHEGSTGSTTSRSSGATGWSPSMV